MAWTWLKNVSIVAPGCTLWPEGRWHHCCVAHDYAYADQVESKWDADVELMICVYHTGHPATGFVMFLGVTLFGWIPWLRYRAAKGK